MFEEITAANFLSLKKTINSGSKKLNVSISTRKKLHQSTLLSSCWKSATKGEILEQPEGREKGMLPTEEKGKGDSSFLTGNKVNKEVVE